MLAMISHITGLARTRLFPLRGTSSQLLRLVLVVACISQETMLGDRARADDPPVVKLTVHPARIDDSSPTARLLPADPDLKPGNAAVVLLRMPWEQMGYMIGDHTKLEEVAQLPPSDPRVAEIRFGHFASEMRRAAFMRDADWNYPVDEEPLDSILLPDLQGLRRFVGHGMTVWVNQQIGKGHLDSAREGVLVQLACARHVARTPFMVNQLVAAFLADQGLDGVERILGTAGAPNLHKSFVVLPSTLGRGHEAVQWTAVMEARSRPTLRAGMPAPGDGAAWSRLMDEWLDTWRSDTTGSPDDSGDAIRARIASFGRDAFTKKAPAELDLQTASEDEVAMRYILDTDRRIHDAAEAAWLRDPPEAIAELVALGSFIDQLAPLSVVGLLSVLPHPLRWYLDTHRFGRRARMLEVVEALRDAAARNGGRFPATLAEVPAHVPRDPFTGEPFLYEPAADGRSARLATPPIPGVDEPRYARVYELTLAEE